MARSAARSHKITLRRHASAEVLIAEIGVDMKAFPTPKHLACGPTCGSTDTFGAWPNHRRALLAKFSRPRSGPGAVPRQPIFGQASTAPNIQRIGVPQRAHNSSVSRG